MEGKIIQFWKYTCENIGNILISDVVKDAPKIQNNPENILGLTSSGAIFSKMQNLLHSIEPKLMVKIQGEKIDLTKFGGTEKFRYVFQIFGEPLEMVEILYEASFEFKMPENWIFIKHITKDPMPDIFTYIPVVHQDSYYLLPIKDSLWKIEEQTPERRSLLWFFPDKHLKCTCEEDIFNLRSSIMAWLIQMLGEPRAYTFIALTILPVSGMEQMNISESKLNPDLEIIEFLKELDPMRTCIVCKLEEAHIELNYHQEKLPSGYYCNYCIKQLLN